MKFALILLLLALFAWTAFTAPSKEWNSESDGGKHLLNQTKFKIPVKMTLLFPNHVDI